MSISRRSFLKGAAAAAAATTASAVPTGPIVEGSAFYAEKKIPHATHFGAFYAHVNSEGRIYKLTPQESDLNPSVITDAIIDRTYSNTRVKYPCVRKSFWEAKGDPAKSKPELRGKEEFVRVSWEEAYELLLKQLKRTPIESLFNASYSGWGHVGLFHSCNSVAGRFFNTVMGGHIGTDGEYSNGAAGKVNTAIAGDLEVYSLQTSYEQMLKHCEVYVMWGCDIYKNNLIDYKVPNRANDTYLRKYADSKIQFINIDPQQHVAAKMLKAEWIKVVPNTDVAMILGMCHHLYKTGKYDKAFIEKYTDGFDEFIKYVNGKGEDKIEKTTAWASQICGIPAKKLEELVELFASKRTFLAGNWANQRAHHGEQADWAIISLACMLGQVGLPGGGFGFSMHYCSGGGAFSGATLPAGLAQGKNSLDVNIPASRVSEAILNPGATINFKGGQMTYPDIKMMYVTGASVIGHHPNTIELIKAIRTLESFIVHEPWWTPMARYADVVLPITSTLERDDITIGGSYSQDYVYAMRKVIEPLWESKNDYDIFEELAKRFGEKEHARFTGGHATHMDWIKEFYGKSDCPDEMPFEDFWEKGFVYFKPDKSAYNFVRHADFRSDPVGNKLATESGKFQLYSKTFASYNLPDFKGHVTWFEPAEYLGNKKRTEKYPFHIVAPHPRFRIHNQLDNTWVRDLYKIQGREPVLINTKNAEKLGIKHGDLVEIFNGRGALIAGAYVTDEIMENVLSLQEGAWLDLVEDEGDKPYCNSGHINVLTSSRPTSQMAQATSANTCLVNIKKADRAIRPNRQLTPPSIIGA